MAVKDVRDYYERMTSDYMEMKRVLAEMEKISDERAGEALNNIEFIRSQVKLLEANYKRLSYVMFLLNQPTKKSKKSGYARREHKKLEQIPEKDRMEGVIQENSTVLDNLKSYTITF